MTMPMTVLAPVCLMVTHALDDGDVPLAPLADIFTSDASVKCDLLND